MAKMKLPIKKSCNKKFEGEYLWRRLRDFNKFTFLYRNKNKSDGSQFMHRSESFESISGRR